jgi:predicted TIM-barrel fold metal-dependent hydrolase
MRGRGPEAPAEAVAGWLIARAERLDIQSIRTVYSVYSEKSHVRFIDAHVHLGTSRTTGYVVTEAAIEQTLAQYDIDCMLVMPQPRDECVEETNERIAALQCGRPGSVFGIVNIDPRLPDRVYERIARGCIDEYGFVAIKVHTSGFSVSPDDAICEKIYAIAKETGVAVMVHTGLGGSVADPRRVEAPARAFPDVNFVFCHAGFGPYHEQALTIARACPNVTLEPSWCPTFAVRAMLDAVGADRIMFGSDHLDNVPVELAKFAALKLEPAQRAAIFAETARRVFRLEARSRVGGEHP